METSIAQVVALTIYGNAFLRGQNVGADFYPAGGTFQFCEHVRFVDLHEDAGKWTEDPQAGDPLAWFETLRMQGVDVLRIQHGPSAQTQAPDRMLVGFVGGGGRWLIESRRAGLSDFWQCRWQVGDRARSDRKIWRVTYGRIARDQSPAESQRLERLEDLSEEFDRHLIAMEEYALSEKLDDFAKLFRSARSRLHSDPPFSKQHYHDLTSPQLMPVEACRLLAACQDAWVFGGMGSWNDQTFDLMTQPRYGALSEALYQLLNRAIVAATNSSNYGTLT